MDFVIPAPLRVEHEYLHAQLAQAILEPTPLGDAAREVSRLLHPHFVKEEDFALPPLGLLRTLAQGKITPDMADVLPMTRRLKEELGMMLAEHSQITGALDKLLSAARSAGRPELEDFADALIMHTRSEEEIFYPAAILVGEYLALQLGQIS
jgi:hypothetical protein